VSEKPGRYQRSTGGLIGALIVTALAVLAFVVFRGAFRGDAEVEVEPVDYAEAAAGAREAGVEVVAPRELPAGWTATSVDFGQGRAPYWGMGVLTDDGKFVGLRQREESVDDLVEEYVDEEAQEQEPTTIDNDLGVSEWLTFTDDGGDTGYAAELGEQTLLVYGSAPEGDLAAMISLLER